MQIRMNDVELNDTPKFLTKNPTSKTHAISGLDQDGHEHIIPFTLRGVTSYIPTHEPLREEFETCPRIKLTSVTEVCYLLEVSWQMCHAWITHWTIARAILTMSRRRSTHDELTHGRDACKPLLART